MTDEGAREEPAGRDFRRRREVVERSRSATWPILIAVLFATIGAVGLGYLGVQLFYLPETMAEARLNRVPTVIGMPIDDAGDLARSQGYPLMATGEQPSEEFEEGTVITQTPPPDSYLPRGDTLWALISAGPAELRMPDLVGLEPSLAETVLRQLGLRVTEPRRAPSDLHPQGTIIETIPPAGTPIEREALVTFVLSRGGSLLTMPDVRGLALAAARDTLDVYSLVVGEVTNLREEQVREEGEVVVTNQEPRPGFRVPAGSAVRLELGEAVRARPPVARTPAPAPVPAPDAGAPIPEAEDAPGEDEAF